VDGRGDGQQGPPTRRLLPAPTVLPPVTGRPAGRLAGPGHHSCRPVSGVPFLPSSLSFLYPLSAHYSIRYCS
jgi:hypothetical protein